MDPWLALGNRDPGPAILPAGTRRCNETGSYTDKDPNNQLIRNTKTFRKPKMEGGAVAAAQRCMEGKTFLIGTKLSEIFYSGSRIHLGNSSVGQLC